VLHVSYCVFRRVAFFALVYTCDSKSMAGVPKGQALLDGHRKLIGSSAIPAGSVWYPRGSIVELEVPPDETQGLMTLHSHNTTVLQSITYAKSPYSPNISSTGQKN